MKTKNIFKKTIGITITAINICILLLVYWVAFQIAMYVYPYGWIEVLILSCIIIPIVIFFTLLAYFQSLEVLK